MFFLLTGKTRTKLVKGGRTLEDRCPECDELATFHEVEVTTSAGLFFVVDIASGTDRAFRCHECGETFDLRDEREETAMSIAAPRAPRDLLAQLEAERDQHIIDRAKRDLAVEDELAALKKKLGK